MLCSSLLLLSLAGAQAFELDAEVLVIGAGMAGLSAMEHLVKANVTDFLLLEATSRIGGRVNTTSFGSHEVHRGQVELGANWVHGVSERNPVWRLAQRIGLRTEAQPGSCANVSNYGLYEANGTQLKDAAQLAATANRVYDCINNTAQDIDKDESAAAALAECGLGNKSAVDRMLGWELTSANDMLAPEQLSLWNMLPDPTYSWLGADDQFVHDQRPLGFSAVAREILREIGVDLDDPRILFNTTVVRIDSSRRDAVRVRTVDGQEFRVRYVISTLPLGVLQADGASLFEPSLPRKQVKAIDTFTMGNFTKLFIQFQKPFWSSKGAQWLAAPGSPHDPMEFHDLDGLEPGFATLFTYVVGDASAEWEALSDEDASARLVHRLRRLFPDTEITKPSAFLMTRHGIDPLMRGAYSTAHLGFSDHTFNTMVAPIVSHGQLRVVFAGEHTCYTYNGFLHGAYFSGVDAASDVLASMGGTLGSAKICRSRKAGKAWRRRPEDIAGKTPALSAFIV